MANFISEDDIEQAVAVLLHPRTAMSQMAANREVDALIRGGVPVEYKAITGPDAGKKVTERLKVIDFDMSAAQAGRNEHVADAASFNACARVIFLPKHLRAAMALLVYGRARVPIALDFTCSGTASPTAPATCRSRPGSRPGRTSRRSLRWSRS